MDKNADKQEMLERHHQMFLDMQKVKNPVTVEPMPKEMIEAVRPDVNIKQCYDNTFRLVCSLPDCLYVVGYARSTKHLPIAIDHAWICVDGVHYDPTWEIHHHIGFDYDARWILTPDVLIEVILANKNYPPSAEDMTILEHKGDES